MTRRVGVLVLLVSGVAALAVGVVMLRSGLARADQVGSVVGAIAGVLGLGVAVYSTVVTMRSSRGDVPPASVHNSVRDAGIDGPNIQIGSVGGDANIEAGS